MVKYFSDPKTILIYILIMTSFFVFPLLGNHAVATFAENTKQNTTVVIDAGHGGVDGGAVSRTGINESHINLQIALKLNDLMHLLGHHTVMIRDTDRSVYTEGTTIAAKKISDIKERVRIVNTTPNAVLVSIHQNHYHDSRYSGAQVFYNTHPNGKALAEKLQSQMREVLCPSNKRPVKQVSGVYLMEHINCVGVLIECGFLSNPAEESKLRDSRYQNAVCCVIASAISQYLNT